VSIRVQSWLKFFVPFPSVKTYARLCGFRGRAVFVNTSPRQGTISTSGDPVQSSFRVLRVFRGLSHLPFSVSNVFSDFVFLLGFAVQFIPDDLRFIL
jgi:hypothetical protein